MKKLLFLIIALSFTFAQAQFNQDAPWLTNINTQERSTNNPVTFQETVDAFNTYWETRDPNTKGSGFKPFKRWENYWKNFVKEDGTLPNSEELWQTWQIVNQTQQRRIDESDWQPIGPFNHTNTGSWSSGQGRVNSITVDPNNPTTYYSGSPAGGFWKSTDSGTTWLTTTDNLPQIGVSGIAVDYNNSDIIYIATGDDDAGDSFCVGVMKSTNGGLNWSTTGLNPGNTPSSMNDIYIHPTNSSILWVATNNGVYKTINSGTSWTNANGTQNLNIRDIKIKPNNPSTIYAVTSNRFYKSTDGGDNFSMINGNGLPNSSNRLALDVTPNNVDVVYVLSANNSNGFQGVYKSINSGDDFSTVATQATVGDIFESTQSWYDMALAVSDTNENEIYVGVLNLWKGIVTNNNSSIFTRLNQWNSPLSAAYTHADIHLLRFYNGNLFAGTDGGFYKSSNGGINFTDLTAGMQISQFYKIAVSKQTSNKMVGGLQDNGGHAFNNNQWQNYYGADGMDTAIDPNNSDLFYGFTQFGGGLYISSTAGGSTSGSVGSPTGENGNWVTPLAMNSESELFAGFSSLYKLNGSSWDAISTSFGTNIDRLEIDDINPDNMYLAINNSLRKSTNRGLVFTNVESFPSNITSIEVNTNDSNIVYVTTSGSGGRVYKSTNGGLDFTEITGSLPNVTKNSIKHQGLHSQNPLFLATSLGVYRYDDTTLDWELFNINLPNVTVTDIEINTNDDKITAATYGRGIWQSNFPTELATNDIKLVEVNGISNAISCNTTVSPQITVKNNGVNIINAIEVNYLIDGANNTFNWNGNLASEATTIIDIPSFSLNRGVHDFKATTTIINDAFETNNSSEIFLIFANDSGVTNDVNGFEDISDELLVFDEGSSSQYWERGIPTGTRLNEATSGTQVYGTNLNGDHIDNIKSYLVSQCYDLSQLDAPQLVFNMAFELEEDWDIVYMEYSTDSGLSWQVLGTSADSNWYNSNTAQGENNTCYNCPGAQWTGTRGITATMQEYSHDLSAFTDETDITFRFVFQSDAAVVEEGVIVDDFVITGTLLSTEEFNTNTFTIFPNPSSSVFNIKMNTTNTFNYNVYDVTGKLIMQENNITLNNNSYKLDMTNYSSGIYFLTINVENTITTKKLILN